MKRLKVISLLMDYPQQAIWQHQQELTQACEQLPQLKLFIDELCALPQLEAEARWVAQFERGRATSLLLFEHVHGESRDRGQAMVDLLSCYEQAGLVLSERELPDYLPLYLEYLSVQPEKDARQGIDDIAPILALITARLRHQNSQYAALFAELLAWIDYQADSEQLNKQVHQEGDDRSPAALDAVWQEEQVRFLSESGGCDSAQQQHQRRFARQPAVQYLNLTSGGQ
ncbi:respiratory nitrate reductase chaperone NarJ [Izhakiella capsodis]|uniref:Respiratory nitrate reductase chaperone NarJ n=1 Tax=Izhakiella capsodis TaxID=1367852 RepID=A0A1I4VAJ3_9GAMM|nr:nitrate reductase molybdenum cofactor assembly chaperone [Izhakiella capsodis]SFM98189.1 respiratory nitrate reductase chaperone NarJ [Izhakiella capsodis]